MQSNALKMEKTWEQVVSNKRTIDKNAETINKNAETINKNAETINANKRFWATPFHILTEHTFIIIYMTEISVYNTYTYVALVTLVLQVVDLRQSCLQLFEGSIEENSQHIQSNKAAILDDQEPLSLVLKLHIPDRQIHIHIYICSMSIWCIHDNHDICCTRIQACILHRYVQEAARKEALAAVERMQQLQAELQSHEHTAAERQALEKEINDNQQPLGS